MAGALALAAAALFTGAAVYISLVEQPARLAIQDAALLAQWKSSYKRGAVMQGTLALVGTLLGVLAWLGAEDWLWLLGSALLVANWPYTLLVILPLNNRLMATAADAAGPETRASIVRWGGLHWVRSALGAAATLVFIWGMGAP